MISATCLTIAQGMRSEDVFNDVGWPGALKCKHIFKIVLLLVSTM